MPAYVETNDQMKICVSPESMITVQSAFMGPMRSATKPTSVRPIAAEKLSMVTGSAASYVPVHGVSCMVVMS